LTEDGEGGVAAVGDAALGTPAMSEPKQARRSSSSTADGCLRPVSYVHQNVVNALEVSVVDALEALLPRFEYMVVVEPVEEQHEFFRTRFETVVRRPNGPCAPSESAFTTKPAMFGTLA
jgi:hypothetical protein